MTKPATDSRSKISRIALQRLEDLERAGISHVPKAKRKVAQPKIETPMPRQAERTSIPKQNTADSPPAPSKTVPTVAAAGGVERSLFESSSGDRKVVPPAERAAALQIIQQEVAACTRCAVLAESRTQTVFGVGSNTARICFFGEAPGADEDRLGEPFVGRGGQLLNKMITPAD